MEKFKIGDTVIITKGRDWVRSMDQFIGQEHIIESINDSGTQVVKFKNMTDNMKNWTWSIENNHFKLKKTLIELPTQVQQLPIQKVEFKIGDKVRIIANTNHSANKVGEIGIITRKEPFSGAFEINCSNGKTHSQWSLINEIELVQEIKEFPKFQIVEQVNTISEQNVIRSAINEEGNFFEVNDKVISIKKGSKDIGFKTILKFRLTKDESNICAVLDERFPNGVGIDKIQHYIELKKLEPQFVLPNKWHVAVTDENHDLLRKWRGIENKDFKFNEKSIVGMCISTYSVNDIGKGHNPITHKNGFGIEITTEQFKKYVLGIKPVSIHTNICQELPLPIQEVPQEESILDRAVRLYPNGTKIRSTLGTIGVSNGIFNDKLKTYINYITVGRQNNSSLLEIYRNGKWAEIIND